MSEDTVRRKIDEWKKPIMIQVGDFRIRDIHAERLTPLQLDMRQLHEVYVESQKRGEAKNELKRD
jgi:hypothetical protein